MAKGGSEKDMPGISDFVLWGNGDSGACLSSKTTSLDTRLPLLLAFGPVGDDKSDIANVVL